MPLIPRACAAALLVPMLAVAAQAQVSRLPMEVQEVLATVGPKWGAAIGKNIEATAAAFRPLLRAAATDGVIVARSLAYGEDAKQILDVYQPIWRAGAPVVIFIHGGAYVRGDKDA
jgi:acetyl esterase